MLFNSPNQMQMRPPMGGGMMGTRPPIPGQMPPQNAMRRTMPGQMPGQGQPQMPGKPPTMNPYFNSQNQSTLLRVLLGNTGR